MKIRCLHGYYIFEEIRSGEISDFITLFGIEITASGDHFTFTDLLDAPRYSLPGGTFLDAPTTVAYEGKPWEVMRANDLIYDFSKGLVVPIQSITQQVDIKSAANYFLTAGMLLAGSLTDEGLRVTDYAAFYLFDDVKFKYSEVTYE